MTVFCNCQSNQDEGGTSMSRSDSARWKASRTIEPIRSCSDVTDATGAIILALKSSTEITCGRGAPITGVINHCSVSGRKATNELQIDFGHPSGWLTVIVFFMILKANTYFINYFFLRYTIVNLIQQQENKADQKSNNLSIYCIIVYANCFISCGSISIFCTVSYFV